MIVAERRTPAQLEEKIPTCHDGGISKLRPSRILPKVQSCQARWFPLSTAHPNSQAMNKPVMPTDYRAPAGDVAFRLSGFVIVSFNA